MVKFINNQFIEIPKGTKEITHNIPYKDLVKPFVGPANPFNPEANENGLENKNTPAGYFEKHSISDFNFIEQQRTFQNFKYALNPNDVTGTEYIGNVEKAMDANADKNAKKKKRKQMGNPSDIDNYLGPWAGYEGETIGELHGATEV
ncbi:hypothetical protein PIROE2DRAFT_3373 [Piromyces sp. E2]|nr:hypothetical protein PIROE2DRAFT_3373 [Piromyces sp. E2]|eukprot:OUM68851.1 hypothetical protein PIROE2DRAFT_3373 [Piromyces sp. E2]